MTSKRWQQVWELYQAAKKKGPSAVQTELNPGSVVLIEVFTGAGCPPCVAADLALDAVLENYSPKDVAVEIEVLLAEAQDDQ